MIIGLTDTAIIRRDGKIRSGYKEGNKLINTDHFLLHDAPGLASSIGEEKPTEIFFTVHSDNLDEVLKSSLRWYNKNELVCRSYHEKGPVAAYFSMNETEGVSQRPLPGIMNSRERLCRYQECVQYKQGLCSEHMFLDIMVPQHSMGAVFTFDNTSLKGLQNAYSVFHKAKIRYGGKLAGQIFRAYKADDHGSYVNKNTGQKVKTDIKVLQFEVVDFSWFEANYGQKIKPDDWNALLALRSQHAIGLAQLSAPPVDEEMVLKAPGNLAALTAPQEPTDNGDNSVDPAAAAAEREYQAQLAKADDPAAAAVFEEIAKLTGRENNLDVRLATAKNFPNSQKMIEYLQGKIREIKKSQQPAAGPAKSETQTPQGQAPTTQAKSTQTQPKQTASTQQAKTTNTTAPAQQANSSNELNGRPLF